MVKLFLDDIRDPPDEGWIVVRSYEAAVEHIQTHGMPAVLSLDHDLGTDLTGFDFTKWIVEYLLDGNLLPKDFLYKVHSANPVGAANIQGLFDPFLQHVEKLDVEKRYMVVRGDDNGNDFIVKEGLTSLEASELFNKISSGHKQWYSILSYTNETRNSVLGGLNIVG